MSRRIKDLSGMKFHRLTVVRLAATHPVRWECVCECGQISVAQGCSLKAGTIKSCGCLRAEMVRKSVRTHGLTKTREHRIWSYIKSRCLNPNNDGYPWYGGAGVTICDRWAGSFETFLADMGKAPTPLHTVDRIKGSKGYEPGNCRWATRQEQANNRIDNRLAEYQGATKTVAEWCRELGADEERVRSRLKHAWSFADAVEKPVGYFPAYGGKSHKDMAGQTFNQLKVIGYSHTEGRRAIWNCVCLACGQSCRAMGKELRNGHKKACGCQQGGPGKPKTRR